MSGDMSSGTGKTGGDVVVKGGMDGHCGWRYDWRQRRGASTPTSAGRCERDG